ncbi:MAG: hypothetical protein CL521_04135 [Actinobacteria bacterium]|nr:hypothetical protein [Actinomycetota bacterium]
MILVMETLSTAHLDQLNLQISSSEYTCVSYEDQFEEDATQMRQKLGLMGDLFTDINIQTITL